MKIKRKNDPDKMEAIGNNYNAYVALEWQNTLMRCKRADFIPNDAQHVAQSRIMMKSQTHHGFRRAHYKAMAMAELRSSEMEK